MIPAHVHESFGPKFHAILDQVSFFTTLTKENVAIHLLNVHMLLCNSASVGGFAKIQMGALLSHVNKVEPCEQGCLISHSEGNGKIRETMRKCSAFMSRWFPQYADEHRQIQEMLRAFGTFKLRYPKWMQQPIGLNLEVQYQRIVQLDDAVQTQIGEIQELMQKMEAVGQSPAEPKGSTPRMPARLRRRLYQTAALQQGKVCQTHPNKGDPAWGKAYLAAQGIRF